MLNYQRVISIHPKAEGHLRHLRHWVHTGEAGNLLEQLGPDFSMEKMVKK